MVGHLKRKLLRVSKELPEKVEEPKKTIKKSKKA